MEVYVKRELTVLQKLAIEGKKNYNSRLTLSAKSS